MSRDVLTYAVALRRGAVAVSAVAVLCCSLGASAEDAQTNPKPTVQPPPLKQLSLEELGNIEVTSQSREPEQVWNTAAAISVLTQEDIRRLGATNIPDMLRMLPGVFVGTVNSNQWAVGVRGFTSNFSKSLLVLIDGRSVYTPLFGGVYWHVQDTLLEDIDRIEVIRGPGGTAWGENAVNGVINIITKKSQATRGVLVSEEAGNLEQTRSGLRIGGGLGANFTYRVFGTGFLRGPEVHPDGDEYDSWHMARGGFAADWTPSQRDGLRIQGDIYRGNTPRRVGTADTEDPVAGGDVLARWSHDLGKGSDFYVQGYVDRTVREGLVFGETQNTFNIDGVLRWHANTRNNVIVGAGYRNNPTAFAQHEASVALLPKSQNYRLYSAFGQDEIQLIPTRLLLRLGLKAEHNIYTAWEVQPSARLLYKANEHRTYWGAVTRAIRTPSQLEEGFRLTGALSPTLELLVSGNKNFQSETLLGYEAGFRELISKRFYVDVATFYNRYDRLQGFLPAVIQNDPLETPPGNAYTIRYGNTVKGTTRGVELSPDWQVTSAWRLSGTYSLLRYNLTSRDGYSDAASVAGYAGSSPLHQWSVQSRLNLPRGVQFDGALRRVGSLPAQKVPAYTTADLRLGWQRHGFELSVVGRDLIDSGHTEFAAGDSAVPTLGSHRSVFGRIVWTSAK